MYKKLILIISTLFFINYPALANLSPKNFAIGEHYKQNGDGSDYSNVILSSLDNWQTFSTNTINANTVSCAGELCAAIKGNLNGQIIDSVLMSLDQGTTWEVKKIPVVSYSDKTYCYESTCFITGNETLLTSKDKGISWVNTYPKDAIYPQVTNVYCQKNDCVALIEGFDEYNARLGGVLVSHDAGSSWKNVQTDAPKHYGSQLVSIDGNENIFVIGGNYNDRYGEQVILVSYDKGNTWISHAPFKRDSFNNGGLINSIHCTADYCVGIGSRYSSRGPLSNIAVSYDNGDNWTGIFPFNFENTTSDLNTVSCVNNNCVAVGTYRLLDENIDHALILISHDRGMTWTYQIPFANIPNVQQSHLSAVHCDMNDCFAVGQYHHSDLQKSKQDAALLISRDHGTSWNIQSPFLNATDFDTSALYQLLST